MLFFQENAQIPHLLQALAQTFLLSEVFLDQLFKWQATST